MMDGHAVTDRVFLRADGRPWNKWAVENRLAHTVTAAEISPLRFHDLRHTIASRLKRRGVHETKIQRLLGHETLAMTGRYTNVEVDQLRAALVILPTPSTKTTQETEAEHSLSGNSVN